jgi:hypothetical protein
MIRRISALRLETALVDSRLFTVRVVKLVYFASESPDEYF